jgi:hypothetical protein
MRRPASKIAGDMSFRQWHKENSIVVLVHDDRLIRPRMNRNRKLL